VGSGSAEAWPAVCMQYRWSTVLRHACGMGPAAPSCSGAVHLLDMPAACQLLPASCCLLHMPHHTSQPAACAYPACWYAQGGEIPGNKQLADNAYGPLVTGSSTSWAPLHNQGPWLEYDSGWVPFRPINSWPGVSVRPPGLALAFVTFDGHKSKFGHSRPLLWFYHRAVAMRSYGRASLGLSQDAHCGLAAARRKDNWFAVVRQE
jgi:hypothetical protein